MAEAEAACDPSGTGSAAGVHASAAAHLAAGRADVVHDLLAHLARQMTALKAERRTYHLHLPDYVAAPPAGAGRSLRDVGRYQPAPGVRDSLLGATAAERDKLRIGRLVVTTDAAPGAAATTVHVRATARYKPAEGKAPELVRDTYGYVETAPLPACTLHGCTALEAGLVVHWLAALDDAAAGFAGYRANATKTKSLLDRLLAARLPDPSAVEADLRAYLANAEAAATLDARRAATDALIDAVVYALYGLTDADVAVVEGR